MKRLLGALLTLLLIPGAAAHGAIPNDPKLEPGLVRLADLPEGFGTFDDPGAADDDDSLELLEVCGVKPPAPVGEIEAVYTAGGLFGTYVFSAVFRFPKGTAKTWMNDASKRVTTKGRCPVVDRTNKDGDLERTSHGPMNVAKIADQSFGARARDVTPKKEPAPNEINLDFGTGLTMELVFARRGDVVAVVGVFQVVPAGTAPSVISLAKKAGARLSKVR